MKICIFYNMTDSGLSFNDLIILILIPHGLQYNHIYSILGYLLWSNNSNVYVGANITNL